MVSSPPAFVQLPTNVMRVICLCSVILLTSFSFLVCDCAIHADVYVFGTTVGPGYERAEATCKQKFAAVPFPNVQALFLIPKPEFSAQ